MSIMQATAAPARKIAPTLIPPQPAYKPPDPARTLTALGQRCGPGGGCPYTLAQIVGVLAALRRRGTVVATEIAREVRLPASTVYGCMLELEDYGLSRWIPEPVTTADNVTAEITADGARFLRELNTASAGQRYAG